MFGDEHHTAASALLIVSAGKACSAGDAELVKTGEYLRRNERTQCFALGGKYCLLLVNLCLAETDALARLINSHRKRLNLDASCGEHRFLSFGALQAGELLVFQPFDLSF
jgi:hypothetical protein